MGKNILDWIALVLVIIGGLNWGLVGLGNLMGSDWNVVGMLGATLADIVYVLVGIAALYMIYYIVKK